MNGRSLVFPLLLTVLSGCGSYLNRSYVNVGRNDDGREVGIPNSEVQKHSKQEGVSNQDARERLGRAATGEGSATGHSAPRLPASAAGPDFAALRLGSPCRIDLIRAAGQGQAYQGTVVRVEDKAIVLSNVVSEGPMKRPWSPNLMDLLEMRMPWSGKTAIDWKLLPDKEVRIAKSEVAAVRVLDHDPIADYYAR